MDPKDVFSAAASLAVVLLLLLLGAAALLFLFTLGSPLLLIGGILGLGAIGLIVLFGILVAIVGVWYVIYAYIRQKAGTKGGDDNTKGNYTLDRIQRTK